MRTNPTPPERHRRPRSPAVSVRPLAFAALLVAHCALSAGCKTNHRYDLIEAELRTRERELEETRASLEQTRNLLRAYEASQPRLAPGPQPQVNGPYLPVKEIALGRGTGGLDDDGAPGDDGLMVVIVPKDEDGSAVKVPARALVAAWEVTPAGLKVPIGSWEIPSDKLRRTWKSGLLSSGYFVAVPWQTPPASEHVRIGVRLVTADGRTYETDRDVTVKPPLGPRANPFPPPVPGGSRVPAMPAPPRSGRQPVFPDMPPPGVPSAVPPGTEELPPPTPTDRGARLLPPVKP